MQEHGKKYMMNYCLLAVLFVQGCFGCSFCVSFITFKSGALARLMKKMFGDDVEGLEVSRSCSASLSTPRQTSMRSVNAVFR